MYLIAAQPERPGSKYYDEKGNRVSKPSAAEFLTQDDAKEFAKERGIDLDRGKNYIVPK